MTRLLPNTPMLKDSSPRLSLSGWVIILIVLMLIILIVMLMMLIATIYDDGGGCGDDDTAVDVKMEFHLNL